jgi:amino-acid N-acetyltransferase
MACRSTGRSRSDGRAGELRIEAINLDDEVAALLAAAQLPVSDLHSSHNLNLLGMYDGGRLVGVVGIEVYGEVGLLRSLAVESAHRNAGLGMRLVADAEAWAARHGVETLYLLTTTAAGFFAGLGYVTVPRSNAPAAIAATAQFAGLCPASSTFMCKVLGNPAQE